MTILVTYKKDNIIYMGSDTQTTGYSVGYCKDKWVKVNINDDEYIMIGISGNAYYIDFFKYGFQAPIKYKEESFDEYLHMKLAPEIGQILSQRKIADEINNQIDTESVFVIVYDDVYKLYFNTAPYKVFEDFSASGSGSLFAYGAYHASNEENIIEMLKICIDAAIRYDAYCGGNKKIHKKNIGDIND